MSHSDREDKPWPPTHEDALAFVKKLFATGHEAERERDADQESPIHAMKQAAARHAERIDRSVWVPVTGRNGANPLVALIRDACDSTPVNVHLPEFSGPTSSAASPPMELEGRLSLVKNGTRPARDSGANQPSAAGLKTLAFGADDNEGSDIDEAAIDELTFELKVPGLPESLLILHAEGAALTEPGLTSRDLALQSSDVRRSHIDASRSAVLTARRPAPGLVDLTTSREELGELTTCENAAFGLVCVQEGGAQDE